MNLYARVLIVGALMLPPAAFAGDGEFLEGQGQTEGELVEGALEGEYEGLDDETVQNGPWELCDYLPFALGNEALFPMIIDMARIDGYLFWEQGQITSISVPPLWFVQLDDWFYTTEILENPNTNPALRRIFPATMEPDTDYVTGYGTLRVYGDRFTQLAARFNLETPASRIDVAPSHPCLYLESEDYGILLARGLGAVCIDQLGGICGLPTIMGQCGDLPEFSPRCEMHSLDGLGACENQDGVIELSELLRIIQFFNSGGFHCDETGEDGYAPGPGNTLCHEHDADYNPTDWRISLSEVLRMVQFFNSDGYHPCPDAGTEDGYCHGPAAP